MYNNTDKIHTIADELCERLQEYAQAKNITYGDSMIALGAVVEAMCHLSAKSASEAAALFAQELLSHFAVDRHDNPWPPKAQVHLALANLDPKLAQSLDGQRIDVAIAAICQVMSNPPSMLTRPLNG